MKYPKNVKSDNGNISLKSTIGNLEKELKDLRHEASLLSRGELAAGTGSWELDLETGMIYASEGALKLYGFENNNFGYDKFNEILLPDYRQILDQALQHLIRDKIPYNVTFKIKNATTGRIIDLRSVCEVDSEKKILGGSIQDITKQKEEEEAGKRDRLDLSLLLKITIDLLETIEKRRILQKIVEGAVQLIGLDTGALYSLNDESLLIEATSPPLPDDYPKEFRAARLKNHPHIMEAVGTKLPVLVRDIETEPLSEEEKIIINTRNMHSLLYIPLVVTQKVTGVMILGTIGRKYDFSQREIDLCHTVSNIGSLTLENSLLFEQLKNNIEELKATIRIKDKAEKSLRLLNRVVEQSPVSIVVTDQNGVIEYINLKFTELTGYAHGEVIGKTPGILKSGYHSDIFYREMWELITSGNDWNGEIMNKKKSGEFYWEKVLISPMTDENGKITHFIGVKEDITEKKKMVENLITAKEKAEENDRLKTAFLHNISHEIRTPLNAILGFSSLLNDPLLTDEQRSGYVDIILSSNDQLLTIIDDIIKISHIETGQVNVNESEVDIIKFTNILFNQFKPLASKKDLGFTLQSENIHKGTMLITDETKLKQILTNLLDNAIKFTHEGNIELGCRINGDLIEFWVADSGIGIPNEEHEKIFERFYQVKKSTSRLYSGTGLGLSISAGYAALLGGQLTVKSKPEKGSIFSLIIPFKNS